MTTLTFDVFWRDRGVSKGLKDLGKDAETGHKHVKTLSDFGPKLVGAFAGFAAADVFHSWIEGARESNRIGRITQNVISSTGGAAHVTADQVGDLATAISNKTGADDEAVQSGQNMLLTFTNVRNEVGKGNDIFNQASGAVVDLAAAMNNGEVTTNGVKTASIQLGKALNDPIKGVTALRKVGVSFTAQQTDQIKTLVQSGHTLEAQKIILREVGKEFGGTAAAAADPLQKLSVIAGNLGEQVGNALLPAVTEFADFMANTGAPALSRFLGVMQGIPAPAYAAAAGLVGVVGAVKAGRVAVEAFGQVSDVVTGGLRLLGLRAAESAVGVERAASSTERAATSTGNLRSRAGGLAGLLGGPYGLALAGAVGVVGLWAKAQADARQRIEDLTGAIKDDSGALGEHSRKLVVDRLESDGVLKAAEKLGLNLADVTDAALGNAEATARVNGQLATFKARQDQVIVSSHGAIRVTDQYRASANQVSDAISGVNGDVREATTSYKRQTTALHGTTGQTHDYWQALLRLPHGVRTSVTAPGLIPTRNSVRGLAADIQHINGKTITIRVNSDGSVTRILSAGGHVQSTTMRAAGGWIRAGTGPTADDVPMLASRGEFVVRASQAGRHAQLLEAINAGRYALGGWIRVGATSRIPRDVADVWAAGLGNLAAAAAKTGQLGGGGGGGGAFPAGPTGGGNTANKALGRSMAANLYGWRGGQWNALDALWMGESGWNNLARNPSSGAFGIPQALPPGKMGPAAAGGNAWAQIMWGLRYIHDVYRTPAGAYGKWLSRHPHWYESGGLARGAGALLKGPRPERILSPRQTAAFEQLVPMFGRGLVGGRVTVNLTLSAPNYVGSRTELYGELARSAQAGPLHNIIRGVVKAVR